VFALLVAVIFERDFELGPVGLDLAVSDNEVLFHDFRNPKLPQCFYLCVPKTSSALIG
jgi:hypothetical protein